MESQKQLLRYVDRDTYDPSQCFQEDEEEEEEENLPNPTPLIPLSIAFSQDYRHFVCGTEQGLLLYQCEPLELVFTATTNGGVIAVDFVDEPRIFAAVRAEELSKIAFCNGSSNSWEQQTISTVSRIVGVRLRVGVLFAILDSSIELHRIQLNSSPSQAIQGFSFWHRIQALHSTSPVCSVYQDCSSYLLDSTRYLSSRFVSSDDLLLACPGPKQSGELQLVRLNKQTQAFDASGLLTIKAHSSQLACVCLSQDGTLVATASVKGTLIRVFNTRDGNLAHEVRRGTFAAQIYSIAFSRTAHRLVVSSDRGTVHLFNLTEDASPVNRHSSLAFMKGALPKFFSSEWSFSRIHIKDQKFPIAGIIEQSLIVVGLDGSYYNCTVGGDGKILLNAFVKISVQDFASDLLANC